MKQAKNIVIAVVIIGLIAAGVGYWQYNKPHRDASTEKVAHALTANELFNAFDTDEQSAMDKYANQLIEVTGTIREVVAGTETNTMLVLESEHPIFGIKCMFQEPIKNELNSGQQITVKGFCSGINGDVEMTRCAIETE